MPNQLPTRDQLKAEILQKKKQVEQIQAEIYELERLEMQARPTCPRCGSKEGCGTVRVLGSGGDYEDWPCDLCRPQEHRRCYA